MEFKQRSDVHAESLGGSADERAEDDFHWTILTTDMSKVDPPVAGLTLDYETNKWKLVRKAAGPDSVHGSFPHITDFLRSMLRVYQGQWQPHARLRLEAEHKERARIQAALAKPIPHRFLSYRPPSGEPITESAFDEAIKRVRDAGAVRAVLGGRGGAQRLGVVRRRIVGTNGQRRPPE